MTRAEWRRDWRELWVKTYRRHGEQRRESDGVRILPRRLRRELWKADQ